MPLHTGHNVVVYFLVLPVLVLCLSLAFWWNIWSVRVLGCAANNVTAKVCGMCVRVPL